MHVFFLHTDLRYVLPEDNSERESSVHNTNHLSTLLDGSSGHCFSTIDYFHEDYIVSVLAKKDEIKFLPTVSFEQRCNKLRQNSSRQSALKSLLRYYEYILMNQDVAPRVFVCSIPRLIVFGIVLVSVTRIGKHLIP